ncbi:Sel1 repeat-containing protein [Andreprevotia lacus DSM 23236]|jgi:TPR repeat protein|uniref:Sel1 repeat-containing protein n=1 Tax=Andreprevotia lacus DSM 23236 TaxID=1121001 RepID=A0A1W1XBJ1_9NEIS|nr:DUF4034 domain-containing protein [Andreprevotia lacus]SMC21405.1 Sel1 repeat-containing protein [Andreprevotia lacus DSM 23236]
MLVSEPSVAQQLADQGLLVLRDRLRVLAAAGDVQRVEKIYQLLEQDWWAAAKPDDRPYEAVCAEGALFDTRQVAGPQRLAFLHAWVQACPESYHAHLMLGIYALRRAQDFRGGDWAQQVSDAQWLAAAVACEHAVVHFCEAMRCNPRAAIAYANMYEIASRFSEPDWLVALFAGSSDPDARPEADEATWQAAAELFEPAGLIPLDVVTTELPRGLPLRAEHDADDGALYWVQQAAQARPNWLGIVTSYAFYRTPRWGGSHEEIEQFAHGPLCAGLNEAERNAVRWMGAHDYFSAFHDWALPEPGAESQIRQWHAQFQPWLTTPLPPAHRRHMLELWACFHGKSLQQPEQAVRIYIEAFSQTPQDLAFGPSSNYGHDFIYQFLRHRQEAPAEFMRALFEQAAGNNNYAALLAWAAVAYRFGMWGVAADPARAEALLDASAQQTADESDGLTTESLEGLLWEAGYHEQALCVARGLAQRDCASSCAYLYTLLRVRDADDDPVPSSAVAAPFYQPQPYRNQHEALRWLERGAELGAPLAEYNFAYHMTEQPEYDLSRPEQYERCKTLFLNAAHKGLHQGWLQLGRVMLTHGNADEQRDAIAKLLRPYALDDDRSTSARAWAMTDLAKAYRDGRGVPKSLHAAKAWITRAQELAPDDGWIGELHGELHGGGSLLGSVFGAFRGSDKLAAEHYPPGMHD